MEVFFKVLTLLCAVFYMVASNENIEEPCKFAYDKIQCVRNYLSKNSNCTIIKKPNEDTLNLEQIFYAYAPSINMTVILISPQVLNVNGDIEAFYLNKDTGDLVFSVEFAGISVKSDAEFIIHQRSKEPKVIKETLLATYPTVLTAVIPASNGLNPDVLRASMITSYLTTTYYDFYIGPKLMMSKDPVVQKTAKALLANTPVVAQELIVTGAPIFFMGYLQNYLCDFGVPIEAL